MSDAIQFDSKAELHTAVAQRAHDGQIVFLSQKQHKLPLAMLQHQVQRGPRLVSKHHGASIMAQSVFPAIPGPIIMVCRFVACDVAMAWS